MICECGTVGMVDVPSRPEQSALLGAVPDEQHRTRRRMLDERARRGEQRHAHRRVVVGAVPDRVAVHRIARAVVILVPAEQDVFVRQRGSVPRTTPMTLPDG